MNALSLINKKLTIIFIAHRLSTIKECDCIYEFGTRRNKAKGKYEELKKNQLVLQK